MSGGMSSPRVRGAAAVIFALGIAIAACDDGGPLKKIDGGASGEAGAVDAPGGAGTADVPPLGTITCGATACAPITLASGIELPACCAAGGVCGIDPRPAAPLFPVPMSTCVVPMQPGLASDECPDFPSPSGLFVGGDTLRGCCRSDRVCGVFVRTSDLDFGCVLSFGFVGGDASAPPSCGVDAGADGP